MSERFNFYDIYGYVIPGFTLLGVLWLPLGIAVGKLPDLGFADALGGLLIAYIIGLVLSSLTALAFPSGKSVSGGATRLPSDELLDRTINAKHLSFVVLLEEKIKETFQVDLTQTLPETELLTLRQHAFLLCRDRLVLEDKGAYAEQFEGMYSMMRGISGASLIGAYYLLGWLFAGVQHQVELREDWTYGLRMLVAVAGLVVATVDFWLSRSSPPNSAKKHWSKIVLCLSALGMGYAGFLMGQRHLSVATRPTLLTALIAAMIFLTGRCYVSYQYFARTFAYTVLRHFLALPPHPKRA